MSASIWANRQSSIQIEDNLDVVIDEIKSLAFDVRLNMASGFRLFLEAASEEQAVQELLSVLRESSEAGEEVLGQLNDLASLNVDSRYQNPHDTALTVLLWLIYFAAPKYQAYAAGLVLRAPQCWYAERLARSILNPIPNLSGDESVGDFEETYNLYRNIGSVPGVIGLHWGAPLRSVHEQLMPMVFSSRHSDSSLIKTPSETEE